MAMGRPKSALLGYFSSAQQESPIRQVRFGTLDDGLGVRRGWFSLARHFLQRSLFNGFQSDDRGNQSAQKRD
jgi:hypothetical protein